MYECINCGAKSVSWQSDFTFDEYGFPGDGVVSVWHCNNCGADILYLIHSGDEYDGNKTDNL